MFTWLCVIQSYFENFDPLNGVSEKDFDDHLYIKSLEPTKKCTKAAEIC